MIKCLDFSFNSFFKDLKGAYKCVEINAFKPRKEKDRFW